MLNRIAPTIEQHLIKEQAGFRPGKSCTSQLLIHTQNIEDGYQEIMITGTAFVDMCAAYDTVNHRLLIHKLFNITQDSTLYRVIRNLLSNRRFYVELNNEHCKYHGTKNTTHPKYLGVTLDRTLSYKPHIQNNKINVATRNNLLKKLANLKWGTNASTIRTTALAL